MGMSAAAHSPLFCSAVVLVVGVNLNLFFLELLFFQWPVLALERFHGLGVWTVQSQQWSAGRGSAAQRRAAQRDERSTTRAAHAHVLGPRVFRLAPMCSPLPLLF